MQETPQEYIQRILAQLGGKDPLKVQAATAAKIARLVQRTSAAKLRKRPAPGKWSVGEILAHLADCEIVTGWRMRQILGGPGTPIQAFDQDAWAAAGHYEKRDARKSVSQSGWITLDGGFAARQCMVQDISTSGAKITVDDPDIVPAKLRLAFSRDTRTGRNCAVVWRRGKSLGVKFVR